MATKPPEETLEEIPSAQRHFQVTYVLYAMVGLDIRTGGLCVVHICDGICLDWDIRAGSPNGPVYRIAGRNGRGVGILP